MDHTVIGHHDVRHKDKVVGEAARDGTASTNLSIGRDWKGFSTNPCFVSRGQPTAVQSSGQKYPPKTRVTSSKLFFI